MRNRPLCSNLLVFLVFLAFLLQIPFHGYGQIEFPPGSEFRYLKGKDAAGLSAGWISSSFDDSGWSLGNAPIRYGDGAGGTVLDDMLNTYSVVYMRTTFMASHADSLDAVNMWINYDDGFVIWINGKKVESKYAPAVLTHDGFATDLHESGQYELFLQEPGSVDLVEGENTLAIQVFNYSLESTDFLMDLSINAVVADPVLYDSTGMDFSVPSGFYEDPFILEVVPSNPSWQVIYTVDGSNPRDSETAIIVSDKASILIDPNSSDGRAQTPAFTVRASSYVEGVIPSFPETRTYIFLDQVLAQAHPGGGWPKHDTTINYQEIDLEMDQTIVYHPEYQDQMIPAMTDIPSISVVTSVGNLFYPHTGIYVNAMEHGVDWERDCSVELIYPDGSEGFNVNAGLRIRGGWSRHPNYPRHGFRVFFRSEYGDAKLDYPLFGDEGVDRFDKIDLRCAQNYSWANGDSRNTYLRDVFSRDLQRDMGQPYTRSRYYHLYLNGMYWGLFQTQERSEARYAADYLGGNTDHYDVIKVDTDDYLYLIEATDGNTDAWYDLWKMSEEGFAGDTNYYAIQGLDEEGMPVAGGKVYVDMDNLIDYMLTIFYTANFDAPLTSFRSNAHPNNFYAIYNREDLSKGFTFYNHDAEHTLFAEVASPGQGLYENRVGLAEGSSGAPMVVRDFSKFHPQWLHYKLTHNAEYRMRFMDRAYLHMEGSGALTHGKNLERLNARAVEIETAIIGESARWGSSGWETEPYTKNDHWIPEVNKIRNDFFPYRTGIVIGQLEEAGLYSDLEPPSISRNGTPQQETVVQVSGASNMLIENTNSSGSIWYTLDGSDPRIPGGSAAPEALSGGTGQVEFNVPGSALVKTRIQYGDEWSAMKEIYLVAEQQDYSALVVTELHYHPKELVIMDDTTSAKDLEFIEFKNTGEEALNLGGLVLDSAVYYEFPENTLLPPGQFYVVASKPSTFYLRYGLIASGNFKKNLSNAGEEVRLSDSEGNPVIHFFYSDDAPWPYEADGVGNSLVSTVHDPSGNPASSGYWIASLNDGGSPFQNDPVPTSKQPLMTADAEILLYPNPTSGTVHIKWPDGLKVNEASFQLFGLNGNLLYHTDLYNSQTVQLDHLNLSPGVYIVKISNMDRTFRKKIVYR